MNSPAKSTFLFGAVQIVSVLFSLLRSKFVAVWMGSIGFGAFALYSQTQLIMSAFFGMGLNTSVVQDIAADSEECETFHNVKPFRYVFLSLKMGVIWCALLVGLIFCFDEALVYLQIEFYDALLLVSAGFFGHITLCLAAIFQGFRLRRVLALSIIFSSLLGFVFVLPILYYYVIEGIVFAIFVSSIIAFFVHGFFLFKTFGTIGFFNNLGNLHQEKELVFKGLNFMIGGLLASITIYITRIYISYHNGPSEVGLYSAWYAVLFNYVGMVFTAMSMDFFPKLTKVVNSSGNDGIVNLLQKDIHVGFYILFPLLTVLGLFSDFILEILYSKEFLVISNVLKLSLIGMFFRLFGWVLSFLVMANGDSKLFLKTEFIANLYALFLNLMFYSLFGLFGLGLAFVLTNLFYFLHLLLLVNRKYGVNLTSKIWMQYIPEMLFVVSVVISSFFLDNHWNIVLGLFFLAITSFWSFKKLNFKINGLLLLFFKK